MVKEHWIWFSARTSIYQQVVERRICLFLFPVQPELLPY